MKKPIKSTYDKLDKLIAPIDKDRTWNSIHTRKGFPKKEKKRRLLIWCFFAFGLLFFVALKINNANNYQSPVDKNIAQTKSSTSSNQRSSELTTNTSIGQTTKFNVNKNETSKLSILKTSKETVNLELKTNIAPKSTTENLKYEEPKKSIDGHFNGADQMQKISLGEGKSSIDKTSKLEQINTLAEYVPIINPENFNSQNRDFSKDLRNIKTAHSLLPILAIRNLDIPNQELFIHVSIDEPFTKFSVPLNMWAIELSAGLGRAGHSIINDSLWQDQSFQTEHTEPLVSYSLAFQLSRRFQNKWRLALRLKYINNRRLFSYEDVLKQYTRQAIPSPEYFYESSIKTKYQFYQQHQTFDLESILFKDFNWKKNSVFAGLGIGVNTLYSFKGKGIDSKLDDLDLQSTVNYKKRLGWHYIYEVGYTLQVNERFYLSTSISGRLRQELNTRGSHRISPLFIGLGFGFDLSQ